MEEGVDYKDRELHVQTHTRRQEVEGETSDTVVEINYRDDGKLHTMERNTLEPLEKTLIRIGRNFLKKEGKKKKKSAGTGSGGKKLLSNCSPETILLSRADGQLAYDIKELTNSDWESGMQVYINEQLSLTVVLNAPLVVSVEVYPKKYARVNNFLVPIFCHENSSGVRCAWYAKSEDTTHYKFVSNDSFFCPSSDLVGCSLKLFCTPFRTSPASDLTTVHGRTVVHYLTKRLLPETALPKALECRKAFIDSGDVVSSDPSFSSLSKLRLVTFNILASAYAKSSYALSTLYDYLENPDFLLSDEYRLQLVVKELLAYRGDIVCLQEVDESAFQKYLNPIFTQAGYVSHHTTKNGTTVEGCATFVSSTKFKTLANIDISLRDVFKSKKKTFEHYLHQLFKVKPDIYEILTQKITTIAQISILKYNNNPRHLCLVANTHLFYHPDAGYIRLLQVHEIMQKLEQIKSSILLCNEHEDPDNALHKYLVSLCADDSSREDENVEYVNEGLVDNELNGFEKLLSQTDYNEGKVYEGEIHSDFGGHQDCDFEVSCFFLGDLNSTVNTGAIEYIERGVVDQNHSSWDSVNVFTWSNGLSTNSSKDDLSHSINADSNSLPRLVHPFKWLSAAGYPQFSNYTKTFKELLDYIYVERHKFKVLKVAPIPTEDVLSENCAIPSEVFPSDHLALVVDVHLSQGNV